MTLLESILLGLLQGITEFLPVSSSGHLVVLRKLLGSSLTDEGLFLNVMLHLGTLAAVFVVFRKDIRRLAAEGIGMVWDLAGNLKRYGKELRLGEEQRYSRIVHNNYRKVVLMILIALIPTALIGVFAEPAAAYASNSLLAAGIGFYVTSVMLLVTNFVKDGEKLPRDAGYWCAAVIGICQGLAVFPGVSRCGITIAACLLCGFHKKFSVKYSFIMSIPTVIGAVIWELRRLPAFTFQAAPFLCGLLAVIIAGIVGYFSIRLLIRLISRQKFKYFAGYCFFIGTTALICHFVI